MAMLIARQVKYAETLRHFSARVVDGEFDLNMDGLREKILSLFKFSPDTELTMTYVDKDSDIVTLVDDEDLRDVIRQGLNLLRITVNLRITVTF
jgi:next to BRCA1 gene 1 protein